MSVSIQPCGLQRLSTTSIETRCMRHLPSCAAWYFQECMAGRAAKAFTITSNLFSWLSLTRVYHFLECIAVRLRRRILRRDGYEYGQLTRAYRVPRLRERG